MFIVNGAEVITYEPIETAPKDGTWIDLWYGNDRIARVRWVEAASAWRTIYNTIAFTEYAIPTHWSRIPTGPHGD